MRNQLGAIWTQVKTVWFFSERDSGEVRHYRVPESRNKIKCSFEKKTVFSDWISSRLFRLHILNPDHVGRSVHTKAYWKVKDFVHGEPLHRPLQKCSNFRNFMIFYVIFDNFTIFFGLDGADPGVWKLLFSSMLRRKHYSKRGMNLKCVIRKSPEEPWFEKWHFIQCIHPNRYELVLTGYQKNI